MPHMHLRGKDFKYTVVYPDGRDEVVAERAPVRFQLAARLRPEVAACTAQGARIDCVAHFDNSANNKFNPDPAKEVKWGDQTWEEMMIGWFTYTRSGRAGDDFDRRRKLGGPMRIVVRGLFLLSILALSALAHDVSGKWTFNVETDAGSGSPTFVFKQDGEKLTGTYSGMFGTADLAGTVKGDGIEFSFEATSAIRRARWCTRARSRRRQDERRGGVHGFGKGHVDRHEAVTEVSSS